MSCLMPTTYLQSSYYLISSGEEIPIQKGAKSTPPQGPARSVPRAHETSRGPRKCFHSSRIRRIQSSLDAVFFNFSLFLMEVTPSIKRSLRSQAAKYCKKESRSAPALFQNATWPPHTFRPPGNPGYSMVFECLHHPSFSKTPFFF